MILTRQQALDIFRRRVSTRHYDPARKISAEDFAAILDFGRLSPSSVGSEPWKFLVIQNQELREKIKPVAWGMQATIAEASHLVILLAKKHARYDSPFMLDGIKRRGITDPEAIGKTLAKYRSFQADDAHLLDSERTLFDWCGKQTYIALANMMTGAALIGIDSCPIEGFNYDEMNRVLAEAGAFDPAEWGVSVAATFGYRAQDIAPKARKPMEDVVTWLE